MPDSSQVTEELSDNSTPQPGLPETAGTPEPLSDLTTDVVDRGIGNVFRTPRAIGTHDQETRKIIAMIIIGLVALLYLAIIAAFLVKQIDRDSLSAAVTAISGVQALAAAAIGFYYGSKKKG